MISVACMGRLGSLELAGGALAIGFTNITGYSVLSGLAMGMEPLCSQAFGSKNLAMVSITSEANLHYPGIPQQKTALFSPNQQPMSHISLSF